MAMVTEAFLVWFLGKLVFFITNLYEKYIVKTVKTTKQTKKQTKKEQSLESTKYKTKRD